MNKRFVFTAIVMSVIVTYALPSFAGQLSKSYKARLDSLPSNTFNVLDGGPDPPKGRGNFGEKT